MVRNTFENIVERLLANRWMDENSYYNGTPCWRWVGAKAKGYAVVTISGKQYPVHRVMASIYLGLNINDLSLNACHSCDVRDCFNPSHLFLGTDSDNQKDSVDKRRHRNSKKTHCPHGHEYTPENTEINNRGQRVCKSCHLLKGANDYTKKLAGRDLQ